MRLALFALVLSCLLAGCTDSKDAKVKSDPVQFLKWSMDKYAALDTFKTDYDWKADFSGSGAAVGGEGNKRTFEFQKPNKFRAVTDMGGSGFVLTSVSDGKSVVEYTNAGQMKAQTSTAPSNVAAADSMQMKHPMFCGTLLYKMFGGSAGYDDLVDTKKGSPTFGAKEKAANGENAQVVKFYAAGTYGNVQMLIGLDTGNVYRIVYDSAGLRELMGTLPESMTKGQKIPDMSTTETFSEIKPNTTVASSAFDTTLPEGVEAAPDLPADPSVPPLPVGKPAPDFQVTGLDGKSVSLASLRGHVVLIDFWATWCGPCKEGLPVTDKLHKELGPKGLKVLAVTAEDKDTVSKYLSENKYAFKTCLDAGGAVNQTYKVTGIPTVVIIDAKGNLSSYNMGLRPESAIREDLKKAGM